MKVFARHIHAELLRAWCAVNLILLGLFTFFDLAAQLDDAGKGDYTVGLALVYELLQLAQRLVELTPFAVLLAAVTALGLMAGRSELVILRGAGVSPARVAATVCSAGAVLLAVVVAIQSLWAPRLAQRAEHMCAGAIAGHGIVGNGDFWLRSRHGVVRIGALAAPRLPVDVGITVFGDDQTVARHLHAARADIAADGRWRLHDVVDKHPRTGTTVHHDTLTVAPALYPRQLAVLDVPPASLSPRALYHYIGYLQRQDQNAQRFRVALWQKLALPPTTLALLLLALPLVFANPRGASFGMRIAAATGIGLLAFAAIQAIGNLAFVFDLPAAPCMLGPAVLIAATALVWLRRLG